MNWIRFGALALVLSSTLAWSQTATQPRFVRFKTTLGDIDVELTPSAAPLTVTNFLNYVNKGAFNGTFFHRMVPGFVAQTGGFKFSTKPDEIAADAAVKNEPNVSNTRGTLAMAKKDGDPNSATNQFFFNLGNNGANLDAQNGGFTVFGRVINASSLAVMDRIGQQRVLNAAQVFGSAFNELPVVNYTSGTPTADNLVIINRVETLQTPTITGVVSAGAFGGMANAAPGSWVEIFGTNLSDTTRAWTADDFRGPNAPTSLDGVSVRISGVQAFVSYVSPTQINAQVAASAFTDNNVSVIVNRNGIASTGNTINLRELVPGLLAPPLFSVGGRQYVVAVRPNGTLVAPAGVSGLAESPAVPGETITLYGVGFGPVTQQSVPTAGRIAEGQTNLDAAVEVRVGDTVAPLSYSGFAPGFVGVYQFNLNVPSGLATGDAAVAVTVNREAISQRLWLPIRR